MIYIYDFTHFAGLRGWCAIAGFGCGVTLLVVHVVLPEETWVQVESAFIAALEADGKGWLLQDAALAEQLASGELPDNDERVPMLMAVSDNGPQMRAAKTAQFMAIARIAQHFGRRGTPNDQAWVESFFGHLKAENPHLDTIDDPADMRARGNPTPSCWATAGVSSCGRSSAFGVLLATRTCRPFRVPASEVTGERTPCLEGSPDLLCPARWRTT